MKYLYLILIISLPIRSFAQVKFAIVCNQKTYQLEVVVEGRQTPDQSILRSGFPNQAAAESFKNSNDASLNCSNPNTIKSAAPTRAQAGPPPKARAAGTRTTSQTTRSHSEYYNRRFMLIGALTSGLNLDEYYDASGAQNLGYLAGIRLLFGQKTKWGIGVQYASLFGAFEPIILDPFYGDEGNTNGIRTELFGLYPFKIGDDSWFYFSIGGAYYLNYKTSLGLDNEDISPQPTNQFWGGIIDLGIDVKGFNIGLGFEFTGDIIEFNASGLQLIRVYTGYSF